MKNILIFLLLLNFITTIDAQSDFIIHMNDTVYKKELYGKNRIRDLSKLNDKSEKLGYLLVGFDNSSCKGNVLTEYGNYPKLVRQDYSNDSLTIWIKDAARCCVNFLGEIDVQSDTLINFKYLGFGEACQCDCIYIFKYQIMTDKPNDLTFSINNKIIELVEFNDKCVNPL